MLSKMFISEKKIKSLFENKIIRASPALTKSGFKPSKTVYMYRNVCEMS